MLSLGKRAARPTRSPMQMSHFYLWLTGMSQIGLENHFAKWKRTGFNGKTKRWSKTIFP